MRKKRDKDKNNAVYMLGLPSGSGVWKRSLDAMGGRLYRASIVAELDSFQSSFPLGDNRFYGQYLNAPLKFSAKYTLVLRALVYSEVRFIKCKTCSNWSNSLVFDYNSKKWHDHNGRTSGQLCDKHMEPSCFRPYLSNYWYSREILLIKISSNLI